MGGGGRRRKGATLTSGRHAVGRPDPRNFARPDGRRRRVRAGARPWAVAGALLAAAALGPAGLAGCSSGAAPGAAGTSCGNTRTGVNVPVTIDVVRGPVNCATALRVEQGYATDIRDGDLRGNGGGAPLAVDGWTCAAYPTPQVLRTGDASECHTAKAEVVAVLSVSSGSSPASTGS